MVLIDQIVTFLEMTSRNQLVAAKVPPADLTLTSVGAAELALIRSTHRRIAMPHHWSSLAWSEQHWRNLLAYSGVRTWIARLGEEAIGLVQLQPRPPRDVQITKFGLIPEFVGRGFGGHLLTLATRLAWDFGDVDRVWLQTTSLDHPHALSNYRRRGFREFRVEHRPCETGGHSVITPVPLPGACADRCGRPVE
ncbi:MAG: GNAT family N-acetyltransferase [Pseudonocardiaceae bacterium]